MTALADWVGSYLMMRRALGYQLVRDEGLLEFRRGRGITVAGSPEQGAVTARAHELVCFARQHGYRLDELLGIIERVGSSASP